jgi:regulatory protein YycI of two-component signal transduction system YycFG
MKTTAAKHSLNAIYKPVAKIDVHDIRQMYGIYCQYYENTTWDIFLRDLSNKTGAFVLYDPKEDRVVGFSTVMTSDIVVQRKAARAVFSGDTVIEKAYRG